MSIALVVTAGFGNGTLSGTIKGVALRGYDIGEIIITPIPDGITVLGVIDATGQSVFGNIDSKGLSALGVITDSISILGEIDATGTSVAGNIDHKGTSVLGKI